MQDIAAHKSVRVIRDFSTRISGVVHPDFDLVAVGKHGNLLNRRLFIVPVGCHFRAAPHRINLIRTERIVEHGQFYERPVRPVALEEPGNRHAGFVRADERSRPAARRPAEGFSEIRNRGPLESADNRFAFLDKEPRIQVEICHERIAFTAEILHRLRSDDQGIGICGQNLVVAELLIICHQHIRVFQDSSDCADFAFSFVVRAGRRHEGIPGDQGESNGTRRLEFLYIG